MKVLPYECPRCGMLLRIKYTLGDGGIKKIETPGKCPICLTPIEQELVVNHICEKDEELNEIS